MSIEQLSPEEAQEMFSAQENLATQALSVELLCMQDNMTQARKVLDRMPDSPERVFAAAELEGKGGALSGAGALDIAQRLPAEEQHNVLLRLGLQYALQDKREKCGQVADAIVSPIEKLLALRIAYECTGEGREAMHEFVGPLAERAEAHKTFIEEGGPIKLKELQITVNSCSVLRFMEALDRIPQDQFAVQHALREAQLFVLPLQRDLARTMHMLVVFALMRAHQYPHVREYIQALPDARAQVTAWLYLFRNQHEAHDLELARLAAAKVPQPSAHLEALGEILKTTYRHADLQPEQELTAIEACAASLPATHHAHKLAQGYLLLKE